MPDRRKPNSGVRSTTLPDFSLEQALWAEGFRRVAGVDEAGRGPLAGPVVAAAVILECDPDAGWPREIALDDSKRMSPEAREAAFGEIRRRAVAWRVAVVPHTEIDRINILRATLAGMAQAVSRLKFGADCVLVDGNQAPPVTVRCQTVVGGDGKSLSVAAASVLAKVVRDRLMVVYDRRYPGWGFAGHKGYPTAAHRDAIQRRGLSPIHRRTFGVCASAAGRNENGASVWQDGMEAPEELTRAATRGR
jgi:ribonuclease HII